MSPRDHFPLSVAAWGRLRAAVWSWATENPFLAVILYMVACVVAIDAVIFIVDLVRERGQ